MEDVSTFLLDSHVYDIGHTQMNHIRRFRVGQRRIWAYLQGTILADSLGDPYDHISIGQGRFHPVAEGRTALAVSQCDSIRSVSTQFIDALFEFEEQLREESVPIDDNVLFLP